MKALLLTAVSALALAFSGSALAADPTTFGGATIDGGIAKLVSDTSVANTPNNDYSGVTLPLPAGLTLAQVTSARPSSTSPTTIAGGSPRFVVNYAGNQYFWVYFGPSPNFTGCTANTWLSTGNLVGTAEAGRVDTSHLTGGSVNSTWARRSRSSATSRSLRSRWSSTAAGSSPTFEQISLSERQAEQRDIPRPGGAEAAQGQSDHGMQGLAGHAWFDRVQRALGR